MGTPVAVDGDTRFETSSDHVGADTDGAGSWELTTSQVTLGQTTSVDGAKVALSATALWTYAGGASGGNPIPPITDSVDLTPGPTVLTDNGDHVLVGGDSESGTVDGGNKIVVTASQSILMTDLMTE